MLKDILLSSSSNLSMADLEDNFGDYKLYGATGFIKCIDFFDKDEEYIAIVKDGAGVGKSFLCDPKSSILSTLQYLTPKNKNNLKFSYYLLYNIHFEKYKVGSTIPHIYYKDYSKKKVFIPSIEEQRKIANFLVNIDKKINLLNQKQKLLRNFKKFCLQNIFSEDEKLRFKEFNKDWRNLNVEDIFDLTRGEVISKRILKVYPDNVYKYPVYSSQTLNKGIMGYYKNFDFNGDYITWTTDGANAGKTMFRKGKFKCSNVCGVLKPKIEFRGMANQFIAEFLNSITYKYVSYVGNPKLMNNVMAKIKVAVPPIDEQKKISNFLFDIDKKIDLTQNQIDLMEKFKKGLLQQMFVYLILYISIFLILLFFKIILNKLEYYFIFHLFKVLEITDKGAYDLIDIILM